MLPLAAMPAHKATRMSSCLCDNEPRCAVTNMAQGNANNTAETTARLIVRALTALGVRVDFRFERYLTYPSSTQDAMHQPASSNAVRPSEKAMATINVLKVVPNSAAGVASRIAEI